MSFTDNIARRRGLTKERRICMLVLGERGIGKRTFLNNLCGKDVFSSEERVEDILEPSQAHVNPEIKLTTKHVLLDDGDTTSVDIVLFTGCGDWLDNTPSLEKVKEHLDAQFESVLNEELRIKRSRVRVDTRCHVCIYFIRATFRGLREFDIYLMKQLGDRVNIIPVLSKADMLTMEELHHNKEMIMSDILKYKINIFDFKDDNLKDCLFESNRFTSGYKSDATANASINDMLPFALICGDERVTMPNNKIAHVRSYRWGRIVVEDDSNSDFVHLKNILLGSHLEELKSTTNDIYYENYRTKRLLSKSASENYSVDLVAPDSSHSTGSTPSSKRRNAFSIQNPTVESEQVENKKNHYVPFSREMEEKNKIIKAYQQKIEVLEKKLDINPDDPTQKTYLEPIM